MNELSFEHRQHPPGRRVKTDEERASAGSTRCFPEEARLIKLTERQLSIVRTIVYDWCDCAELSPDAQAVVDKLRLAKSIMIEGGDEMPDGHTHGTTEEREERWLTMYDALSDEVGAWRELGRVEAVQAASGLLKRLESLDLGALSAGNLTTNKLVDVFGRISAMVLNQQQCKHDGDTEVIGQIPMGSFTAERLLCKRCGRIWLND